MPVYILVKAVDGWNEDGSNPLVYMSGYMVNALPINRIGGRQVPPNFIQIAITDTDDCAAINAAYCKLWVREIDYEFVDHDYVDDLHRLRVFVKPTLVSASGIGSITRDMVETFLNRWNASVVSAVANEVIFDARVYSAVCSPGFWDKDVMLVVFSELSYTQATGIHKIRANYGNDPVLSTYTLPQIENYIIRRGGTVTKNVSGRVEFTIERGTVFDIFKQDVKDKTDGPFQRRVFRIPQQYVDMALANEGTLSCTWAQFAQYVRNRLDD